MAKGEAQGGLGDDVTRFQIERAVKWHFEKLKMHKARGIKILSLIFIDEIANYREYDERGDQTKGKFALWFEEIFEKYEKINGADYKTKFFGAQEIEAYLSDLFEVARQDRTIHNRS